MILTPRQLKHFENFQVKECVEVRKDYKTHYEDVLELTYIEDYNSIFGVKKEKTWTKEYRFRRSQKPSDEEGYTTHTMSPEYLPLKKQLEDIVLNKWEYITKENLDYFTEKYPERFI